MGIDAETVMGVARRRDKHAHRLRRLGLAQQKAMNAPSQDLTELPGVAADAGRVSPAHGRLDNDGWRSMARVGWPSLQETAQIFGQARHIKRTMFHADVDVVGPGMGVLAALRKAQHVTRVLADVVDGLVLRQKLHGTIDTGRHLFVIPCPCTARGGWRCRRFPPWDQHKPFDGAR